MRTVRTDPRPRGLGIRTKLALSYTGFLLVAGVVLGGVLLLVLRYVPDANLVTVTGDAPGSFAPGRSDLVVAALPLVGGGLALLAVIGLVGGWVLAGRVLRPLQVLTDAVRTAGRGTLSHRVRLPGPRDEVRELADHFDDMLDRLERAFEEQRRFTANASHELRTPNAAVRTMIEVARADPAGRDVDTLLARLAELTDRSSATVEAMLHLAQAEQGGVRRGPCDLVEVLEDALEHLRGDVEVVADLPEGPVLVDGDRPLLDHLVRNLLENAVVHNLAGGGVVRVGVHRTPGGSAVLRVANTGPVLDPAVVATLTEPFVRGAGRVRGARGTGGSGLGLAIVASVARAHDARLDLAAGSGGGLTVDVEFPGPSRPGR